MADGAIPEPPSVAAPPPLGLRETPDAAVSDRARSGAGAGVASARKAAPTSTQPTAGFAVQGWAHSRRRVPRRHSRIRCARTVIRCICLRRRAILANWRVRVGPLSTRPEAEKTARRLEAAEKLPDVGARRRLMTSRWLIAGCRGQLGRALGECLAADPGCEVVAAIDREEVDLADAQAVCGALRRDSPRRRQNVAVNAAGVHPGGPMRAGARSRRTGQRDRARAARRGV